MENQRKDGIEVFVGISVGYLLFCITVPEILAEILTDILPGSYRIYYAGLSLLAGLIFVNLIFKNFKEVIEWNIDKNKKGIWEALITGLLLFIAVNFLISPFLGSIFESSKMNYAENVGRMFETPIVTFIQVVIIAPLLEELIYRGFLLKRALRQRTTVTAILLVAGFFGILHLSIVQGLSAFLAGILLCLLYVRRESVGLCILAHSFYNGLTFMMMLLQAGVK